MSENAVRDDELRAVERAVDALRAGALVGVRAENGAAFAVAAAERLSGETLTALKRGGAPDLVLTHHRAATLRMRLYTPQVVAIPVSSASPGDLRTLADPADDLMHPLRGPFAVKRETLSPAYAASVRLAKLAGLLPAVVVAPAPKDLHAVAVSCTAIDAYDDGAADALELISSACVPLAGAENTRIFAFRPSDGGPEHLAIVVGDPAPPGPVLARLHSECFTGDLLGSLKCDCGDQLRAAIAAMGREGAGVLLYLSQEGRGIGLMNKLRAYRLQDQGFDTMEANRRLGFEDDERSFRPAAAMLRKLGFTKVRLLTNNPEKVAGLAREGIEVTERVPHAFPANPHNAHYLAVKRDKGGHDL